MNNIGSRLKVVRTHIGLNQEEFAVNIDCTQRQISSYENNVVPIPQKVLQLLLKTYKIDINWLVTGKGNMFVSVEPEDCQDDYSSNSATPERYQTPKDRPRLSVSDRKARYFNLESRFQELSEHDQVGLVFKVLYEWDIKSLKLLKTTIEELIKMRSQGDGDD